MKTLSLLTTTGLLLLGLTTNATVDTSKIVCTYNSSGGTQTVSFDGPAGFDLSAYPPSQNEVPLKINGADEPTLFRVREFLTHNGSSIVYSSRNPFFANDIAITYSIDPISGFNRLSGTWTVDHPPVLQLNCNFSESSN